MPYLGYLKALRAMSSRTAQQLNVTKTQNIGCGMTPYPTQTQMSFAECIRCILVSLIIFADKGTSSNLTLSQDNTRWKNQTADLSWWPKASTFAASGLYAGYWTPNCEYWFQKRLSEIANGTATLIKATEWTAKLKLHRPVRKLAAANSKVAQNFLQSSRAQALYEPQ